MGKMATQEANNEFLSMTVMDVQVWLESIGFNEYCDKFIENKINGLMLCDLDDETLESDMGIDKRLHRRRLLKEIKNIPNGKQVWKQNDVSPAMLSRRSPVMVPISSAGSSGGHSRTSSWNVHRRHMRSTPRQPQSGSVESSMDSFQSGFGTSPRPPPKAMLQRHSSCGDIPMGQLVNSPDASHCARPSPSYAQPISRTDSMSSMRSNRSLTPMMRSGSFGSHLTSSSSSTIGGEQGSLMSFQRLSKFCSCATIDMNASEIQSLLEDWSVERFLQVVIQMNPKLASDPICYSDCKSMVDNCAANLMQHAYLYVSDLVADLDVRDFREDLRQYGLHKKRLLNMVIGLLEEARAFLVVYSPLLTVSSSFGNGLDQDRFMASQNQRHPSKLLRNRSSSSGTIDSLSSGTSSRSGNGASCNSFSPPLPPQFSVENRSPHGQNSRYVESRAKSPYSDGSCTEYSVSGSVDDNSCGGSNSPHSAHVLNQIASPPRSDIKYKSKTEEIPKVRRRDRATSDGSELERLRQENRGKKQPRSRSRAIVAEAREIRYADPEGEIVNRRKRAPSAPVPMEGLQFCEEKRQPMTRAKSLAQQQSGDPRKSVLRRSLSQGESKRNSEPQQSLEKKMRARSQSSKLVGSENQDGNCSPTPQEAARAKMLTRQRSMSSNLENTNYKAEQTPREKIKSKQAPRLRERSKSTNMPLTFVKGKSKLHGADKASPEVKGPKYRKSAPSLVIDVGSNFIKPNAVLAPPSSLCSETENTNTSNRLKETNNSLYAIETNTDFETSYNFNNGALHYGNLVIRCDGVEGAPGIQALINDAERDAAKAMKRGSFRTARSSTRVKMQSGLRHVGPVGRGAGGTVFKAIHVPSLRVVAVKEVVVDDKSQRKQMRRELDTLLYGLNHRNVVQFYDSFYNSTVGTTSMVFEYMDAGSLQDIVDTKKAIDSDALSVITLQCLQGLDYLHGKNLLHRDIKPSNILINSKGIVKIADFGISRDLEDTEAKATTYLGTCMYMSPERIKGKDYSFKADLWSLGLSVLTCALGRFPFQFPSGYWGLSQAILGEPFPSTPTGFSTELAKMIGLCLKRESNERVSTSALLNSDYFQEVAKNEEAILKESNIFERYCNPDKKLAKSTSDLDKVVESVTSYYRDAYTQNSSTESPMDAAFSVKFDIAKLRALAEQMSMPPHKVVGVMDQGLRRLDEELKNGFE